MNSNTGKGILLMGLFAVSFVVSADAREYHVAAAGGRDFTTIQAAADVMQPGDVCIVHKGVYRETVRPKKSGSPGNPMVFRAAGDGPVVVSGGSVVTGWTRHSGNIFKASLGNRPDEVLVDGIALIYARHPNVKPGAGWYDMFAQTSASTPPGGTGGTVSMGRDDRRWVYYTAGPDNRKYFGNLRLLDSEGEWVYENKTLYAWFPGGGDPSSKTVEGKVRDLAFDLSGLSHITINGISIRAGRVSMVNSVGCTFKNADVDFPVSFFLESQRFNRDAMNTKPGARGLGIEVSGSNNLIESCRIRYSYGDGVTVYGNDNSVINCVINDINFSGTDCAPIVVTGSGHTISRNTVFRAGRSGILHRGVSKSKLTYNHVYEIGLMTEDLGNFYTCCQFDSKRNHGQRTVIAYNLIHANRAKKTAVGIYLDNGSEGYVIHNNVIYDCPEPFRLNGASTQLSVYDSVFYINNTAIGGGVATWRKGARKIEQNNIMTKEPGPWKFVSTTAHDYRLTSASTLAIDKGVQRPPWTNGFKGAAPDLGAYEFDSPAWKAGSSLAGKGSIPTQIVPMAPHGPTAAAKSGEKHEMGSSPMFDLAGRLISNSHISNPNQERSPRMIFGIAPHQPETGIQPIDKAQHDGR